RDRGRVQKAAYRAGFRPILRQGHQLPGHRIAQAPGGQRLPRPDQGKRANIEGQGLDDAALPVSAGVILVEWPPEHHLPDRELQAELEDLAAQGAPHRALTRGAGLIFGGGAARRALASAGELALARRPAAPVRLTGRTRVTA